MNSSIITNIHRNFHSSAQLEIPFGMRFAQCTNMQNLSSSTFVSVVLSISLTPIHLCPFPWFLQVEGVSSLNFKSRETSSWTNCQLHLLTLVSKLFFPFSVIHFNHLLLCLWMNLHCALLLFSAVRYKWDWLNGSKEEFRIVDQSVFRLVQYVHVFTRATMIILC